MPRYRLISYSARNDIASSSFRLLREYRDVAMEEIRHIPSGSSQVRDLLRYSSEPMVNHMVSSEVPCSSANLATNAVIKQCLPGVL